jgi:hypothetical protein
MKQSARLQILPQRVNPVKVVKRKKATSNYKIVRASIDLHMHQLKVCKIWELFKLVKKDVSFNVRMDYFLGNLLGTDYLIDCKTKTVFSESDE